LASAPVLKHFDPEKGTILHADASLDGIGAILLQEDKDGQRHPVAYVSRSLSKAEKNYSITELELLSVVWALGYLRHLIYGRPVEILSDHHALCYLRSMKENNRRLTRWGLKLSEFQYSISYKNARAHRDADCMSRNPVLPPESLDEDIEDFHSSNRKSRRATSY
jgi:hypothetical protein